MVYPPRLNDHELVDGILDMFERKTPDYFELQIRALLTRPDAASVVSSNLQCPTLVLCGREDAWSPPARHAMMADMVRHSTLVIIPECGHMSPLERPQAVSAALRGWLESIDSAP
jgi:pimeloyl-ACP methyl ester carboxylesterase